MQVLARLLPWVKVWPRAVLSSGHVRRSAILVLQVSWLSTPAEDRAFSERGLQSVRVQRHGGVSGWAGLALAMPLPRVPE